MTTLRATPWPSMVSARPPRTIGLPPYFLMASLALAAYSAHAPGLVTLARAMMYPFGIGVLLFHDAPYDLRAAMPASVSPGPPRSSVRTARRHERDRLR